MHQKKFWNRTGKDMNDKMVLQASIEAPMFLAFEANYRNPMVSWSLMCGMVFVTVYTVRLKSLSQTIQPQQ